MKCVYCSRCGTKLKIFRRALPEYQRIIDIVEYHECPKEPVKLDLTPIKSSKPLKFTEKDKFVQNLNELSPPTPSANLQDKRKKDQVKSSAPSNILEQFKSMQSV